MSNITFINGVGNIESEASNFDYIAKELGVENVTLKWQHVSNNTNDEIKDFGILKNNWIRRTLNKFGRQFIADAIFYIKDRGMILDEIERQMPDECDTIIAHSLGTIIAWDYLTFRATRKFNVILLSSVIPFYWRGNHYKAHKSRKVLSLYNVKDLIAHKMNLKNVEDKRVRFHSLWTHSSYLKSKKVVKMIKEFLKGE